MSVNILEMVQSHLTDGVKGSVASLVGLGGDKANAAIGAAVPSLIGGFAKKASTDDGAEELLGFLKENTDVSALSNVGGMFEAANSSALMGGGKKVTDFLFGSMFGKVASSLEGASGLASGLGSKLLGALAPLVSNVIGGHAISKGLGAAALAGLLKNQGGFIKNLLPGSLGSLLGLGAVFGLAKDAVGGAAKVVGGAASGTAAAVTGAVGGTASAVSGAVGGAANAVGGAGKAAVKKGGNFLRWLLPLLLLLLALWLLWKYVFNKDDKGTNGGDDNQTEQVDNNGGDGSGGDGENGGTAGGDGAGGDGSDGANGADGSNGGMTTYAGTAGDIQNWFTNAESGGVQIFNFGDVSADGKVLSEEARAQFDAVAAIMKAYPQSTILVRGHTKEAGANLPGGGKARAILVELYLQKEHEIDAGRIKTKGMKFDEPLEGVAGDDPAQRRVTIEFTN